jgi:nitrogenase molybdenum-iron protein alpha/beta subunit
MNSSLEGFGEEMFERNPKIVILLSTDRAEIIGFCKNISTVQTVF